MVIKKDDFPLWEAHIKKKFKWAASAELGSQVTLLQL